MLTLSTPGIHYPSTRPGPLQALCGSDGSYGSLQFVTCPACLALLRYAWVHFGMDGTN